MKKIIFSALVLALVGSGFGVSRASAESGSVKASGVLAARNAASVVCRDAYRVAVDQYTTSLTQANSIYRSAMDAARTNHKVALQKARDNKSKDEIKAANDAYKVARKAALDVRKTSRESAHAALNVARQTRLQCLKAARAANPVSTPTRSN
ncbi:MAG: hypothetical protein A3A33_00505 [Candidatus Yanofskybacteria bacterium RIFCSPLOWO2_01_FULL_49_25]|uniref:DUF4398 domain-containing protein n=1 Tax=Candidatus Yanofskybacteria bacterium RIFCSPLOWO2_01_FULL_49_25 TaxID=1802701 RepID=A0A1F8GQU9_9BACT|nr:MAG: hypothetical protein A3A33_00505 [Candidatus Yanofskybacteria bacterium RIFCSPLOWO2_01_FULL_49_25]